MQNTPQIIIKVYDFLIYLIPQIEKFPRSQRYLLGERLELLSFDVLEILLDACYSSAMPKVNGYQVCRELKGEPKTKSIPIILLTAKTQESDKYWDKETGADDYITKPYGIDLLLQKIRHFWGETG